MKLDLAVDTKAALGEGPHWDDEAKLLYWVDITGKTLHCFDPAKNTDTISKFDQMVSAVIPSTRGSLILAMKDGIYSYSPSSSSSLMLLVEIERDLTRNRLNDAKCDPLGRLWAGTMNMDFETGTGGLYVLEPSGKHRKVLSGINCSNGIAWDEQRSLMYYIDTMTRRVDAFHYDKDSGNISDRRTVIDFTNEPGWPDGMTIDVEGMLWIAHWGGGRVSRWDPVSGRKLDQLIVPALFVTSCVFGGDELDELYITTAREGMMEEQFHQYPHAGGLFVAKLDVQGLPSYRFAENLKS